MTESETPSMRADANGRPVDERLERRLAELHILYAIGHALQAAVHLDRILHTVLVGATAHQGLSFNRAFILIADHERGMLAGRAGIGPADGDEAARLWPTIDVHGRSLTDLLADLDPAHDRDSAAARIARGIEVPIDGDGLLARALRDPDPTHVEDGIDTRNGRPVETELLERLGAETFVAVPLVAGEVPVGLLLADNAITERRIEGAETELLEMLGVQAGVAIHRALLLDEARERAAELERATREIHENQRRLLEAERLSAVGQMAARLAHEIRNPLVVIGGFARALLEQPPNERRDEESLAIIIDEVRRLESIVSGVLEFAKSPTAEPVEFDVAKACREAIGLLRFELEKAKIESTLRVAVDRATLDGDEDDPEALAYADRDQVFQALINVLQNAMHAMPEGGSLDVAIHPGPERSLEVAIADRGGGIPEAVKGRVLDPFVTTKSGGTGLGLPIVRQIMRNNRGKLDIRGREGGGTVVTLRLPTEPQEE